jgi:hypothetical protein
MEGMLVELLVISLTQPVLLSINISPAQAALAVSDFLDRF